ncbi:hypothetical protein GCM10011367_21540 [Marinicauda pacifica]|uniref:Uncharacterized protein n=1 Tax=Marinicauda pacifica TaxID=1133559 RepID=A0A4S2H8J5_9PROT|nr:MULTISPECIES: hypothetical protein [Marinicauda]TGY92154.1 hypothetical protein E5162_10850 [Marinicauda pacifica]GGE46430.1 hypothetical protein GCM10011367_21540 [Marinicauda pacifica]
MYELFPKMIIAIVVYAAIAFTTGIAGGEEAFIGNMQEFRSGNCVGMVDAGPEAVECAEGALHATLFTVPTAGTQWALSLSDLLITLALVMLFLEMLKAPGTGNVTVYNNLLSTGVFIVAILLFVLQPLFATSTFFIIMLMTLVDTAAGWFITVIASRRDLAVGGEG